MMIYTGCCPVCGGNLELWADGYEHCDSCDYNTSKKAFFVGECPNCSNVLEMWDDGYEHCNSCGYKAKYE